MLIAAIGAMVVPTCLWWVNKGKGSPPRSPEGVVEERATSANQGPFEDEVASKPWRERPGVISGRWVSADGQQSAILDFATLRFGSTRDWPDLEMKAFPLDWRMTFATNVGRYSITTLPDQPDELRFVKQDFLTQDLTGFTLYREGSPRANSRTPLPDVEAPLQVKALLDWIPTLAMGEGKNAAMKRLGLEGFDKLEVLSMDRGLGETDQILSLGIDDHWMLKLGYSQNSPDEDESKAVLKRFQLFRGHVSDVRQGRRDVERIAYPYFAARKIIHRPLEP